MTATTTLPAKRAPRPVDTTPRPWQCSSLTAHYCPLCGDCACGPDKRSIANLSCPLHGRSSQHGERKEMVQ